MTTIIAVVLAYLLGSISFAVVCSKLFGLTDPRQHGSGNPGATNVLRTGNKTAAALTLAGDALKGAVAVWLAMQFGPDYGLSKLGFALVALAVFLGHLFPLYHGFKGGKGVATAAGILLALNVWLGLATIVSWLLIAFFFRYSSLAALVAAVFAPFYSLLLFGANSQALAIMAISALLVWRHAANIGNLMAGKESRIGGEKSTN